MYCSDFTGAGLADLLTLNSKAPVDIDPTVGNGRRFHQRGRPAGMLPATSATDRKRRYELLLKHSAQYRKAKLDELMPLFDAPSPSR
jgi:hypothetical protein